MPPARRQLKALGSLQLVGYANNPSKVITELAFIADAQAADDGDLDTPLDVKFNDFMDGVNSRGRGTKIRHRKMTVEQAAAVLLVTVQKGHVELITKEDDPHTIDVIKILPGAKRLLATFLPKLRGYGNIPYDEQYRGAIALAKRHFFPKGKAPTKKELMALLLQSYQEKRELCLRRQTPFRATKALGIQTSFRPLRDGSCPDVGAASGESAVAAGLVSRSATVEAYSCFNSPSGTNSQNDGIESTSQVDSDLVASGHGQHVACTPVAPKSFNPYMTPVSNPRLECVPDTPGLLDAVSPTLVDDSDSDFAPNEDSFADHGIGGLLQTTATTEGKLNYYYNKFIAACQRIVFLEGQREAIEKEFDLIKRQLHETQQQLQEANADKWKLTRWVEGLLRRVDSIYGQLGVLRGMTYPDAVDEWSVYDPSVQGGFDPNSI